MVEDVRVADEVRRAAAGLRRSHRKHDDFTINRIMQQAATVNVAGHWPLRSGVRIHVDLHRFANKPPNPGRYRTLLETRRSPPPVSSRRFLPPPQGHRKAYAQTAVKSRNVTGEPLDWYAAEYLPRALAETPERILALRGLGKDLWAGETADDDVMRQRSAWS